VIAFAIAVVLGLTSYALSPSAIYGSGGYPGPDALPGVPTYGSYLGTIPVGHHSPISYVCGLDAPNATNHSPKDAFAYIDGQFTAFLPISTQFGCAEFVLYVSATLNGHDAPCGYAYAQINSGKWILVRYGTNYLLITGIKHYHHVGAYFPFFVPTPANQPASCTSTTTTTNNSTTTTIPNTTTPTTNPGQSTTTGVSPTSSTIPGFHTTTTKPFNAGSTTTVPNPINSNPGTVIGKITQVVTLIAVVLGAGAAAAGAGQFLIEVPEALVEEYTTEIPPGGGLPYNLFPAGGSGTLSEEDLLVLAAGTGTDIPAGGGYSMGGASGEGAASDEFFAQIIGRLENEEVVLFIVEDESIPPAGGAPQDDLSGNTGGLGDMSGGGSSPSSGGSR
jgi:hypothetical protein